MKLRLTRTTISAQTIDRICRNITGPRTRILKLRTTGRGITVSICRLIGEAA